MAAEAPFTSIHNYHHSQQATSLSGVEMSEHSFAASDVSNDAESQDTEMQETQPVDDVELGSRERRAKEEYDARLWGFLHPCTTSVSRIDFLKPQTSYQFGRNRQQVDIVLTAAKISTSFSL
jgi:ser/thr/tyr protein kinase RAD53